jgi:septum site-determining protein MinD
MILAVTGGKGGVGKSTVALNVAAALDATLVDADLGMADLPTGRGPDLHDVLAGRADVREALTRAGPLRLVPCGRTLAGARAAEPTALADALERLERAAGPVVVDCPAGLSSDVGVPLVAATACLLVSRPAEAALTAALRVRELARALDAPLVAVALTTDPGLDVETADVAAVLGAPVTRIPHSRAVATAQSAGLPVTAVAPEEPAAERFGALADAVHSSRSAT